MLPIPILHVCLLSVTESMTESKCFHLCTQLRDCWAVIVTVAPSRTVLRPVTSSQEVVSLVYQGMQHRAADSTLIHEHSSRSHLIVTISIECRGAGLSDASSTSSLVTPTHSRDSTTMVTRLRHRRPKQCTENVFFCTSSFANSDGDTIA